MSQSEIVLPAPKHSHYVMMPFIADDELDPYETKVIIRYIRLSWGSGKSIDLGGREGEIVCKMGRKTFYKTRQSLHDKGYIILTESSEPEQPDIVEVCVDKIWSRNAEKYQSAQEISHDLAVHITSGKLDEVSLLGLKELIEQMLGVESIDSGGGVNMPQGGVNMRQGWSQKTPHLVDIESIEEDSSLDGDAVQPPVASPREPAAGPSKREGGHAAPATPSFQQSPADKPIVRNIEDHPLVLAIVEATGGKRLSDKQLDQLRAKIHLKDDGGERKFPSLIDCYETFTGFDKFVKFRLEQAKNSDFVASAGMVIGNLRKFTKDDSSWYGWLKWKQLNPEYTADRTVLPDPDAPARVEYLEVNEEALSLWMRRFCHEDETQETE